jgi:hypothetical protein
LQPVERSEQTLDEYASTYYLNNRALLIDMYHFSYIRNKEDCWYKPAKREFMAFYKKLPSKMDRAG